MDKQQLRIVYMGTPEFAVESLRRLVEGGYNVVAVVTMPDKPVGRHQDVLQASAVKQYALQVGLPVLQPVKLKDPEFVEELRSYRADLQIVVAFRMLPEIVWNMPSIGTFNLHASLLPQYRGAAPINWAIINGEKETGVTTFFLTHEIDTGAIIHQKRVPIAETDDAGTVHDRLMELGGSLVIETVEDILRDDVHPVPQEQLTADVQLRPAPKIFKETCRIDWNKPMDDIYNFVRGLSPYPAAWTEMEDEQGTRRVLKIFATEKVVEEHQYEPGTVVTDGRTYFYVAVQGGYLSLTILQIAGKKRMPVSDFLRGFRVENALKLC
jgi:methionyl-tRNA formyltransferase